MLTIPAIVETLAEFIADPEPFVVFSNPPLDIRKLAIEVGILPIILDMGGCLGLRLDGEVFSLLWEEPWDLRHEKDPRVRNMILFQAGLKYPALRVLAPVRPLDAPTCESCNGTGQLVLPGMSPELARSLLCYCGGVSWLPPTFQAPLTPV